MTTPPAARGWYPDPRVPQLMRWWDGTAWTDDTYERTEPMVDWTVPAQAATGSTGLPASTASPSGRVLTTEDGQVLAGWGARLLARLIDMVIITVITLAVSFPAVAAFLRQAWDEAQRAAETGTQPPSMFADPSMLEKLALVSFAQLIVSLVYEVGFLLWRAATPGKLAVGLRVRPWTPGERLNLRAVIRRWLGFFGAQAVPYVGPPYVMVDVLWPLRDSRRQALHDKFAQTCVVQARGPQSG